MKRSAQVFEYSTDTEKLAKFAKALGHPARIIILKHLSNQSCCFTGDLLEVLPLAQSTVSQHLKILKQAGLVTGETDGPRSCYCIDGDAMRLLRGQLEEVFRSLEDCC